MIARTATPERWAGVFFTGQTVAQLLLAIALAVWIMPRLGRDRRLRAIAVCALARRWLRRDRPEPARRSQPRRGDRPARRRSAAGSRWSARIVRRRPPAARSGSTWSRWRIQAGLDPGVARTALWVSLAGQVVGGGAATALAGRVRWFHVFLVTQRVTWSSGGACSRSTRRPGSSSRANAVCRLRRPVAGPVPGADDHRGRPVAPRGGAERRAPS